MAKPSSAFSREIVLFGENVGEKDVGRFTTQFQRHGNDVFARVLHNQTPGRGFAGEGDFGHARTRRERFARLDAESR